MLRFLKGALGAPRSRIYGLDHAVLNVQLPPQSMWMNVGYWEVSILSKNKTLRLYSFAGWLINSLQSTTDFPQACQALLDQVLAAGLLTETDQSVRVLDVGCGCGDQSLYLMSLMKKKESPAAGASGTSFDTGPVIRHRGDAQQKQSHLLLDSYIGITLEPAQARFAQQRARAELHDSPENSSTALTAEIFCADAANPRSWSGPLQASISDMAASAKNPSTATWLLALDTMYHFRPSRLPILRFARNTLQASLMAFDIILADEVSWRERLMLRFLCWLTGSPFSNFILQREYIDLLVAAGYDRSQIEIRDVSRHVFKGLADFLGRRVEEAGPFGIKMGKFRAARVVFDWWANSGIVRGVVVVARRS